MPNKQNFIKGTLILVAANAISKILGAVFKIPLTYILREEGMAVFNTAFSVYGMLLSFITAGMPLAISKMVAEELALERPGEARKIVTVSTLLLSLIGLLGTAVMFCGADFFAGAMKDLKAAGAIRFLSPAIFFVAVGTVFKSYYQGKVNMIPTAVSQVIEAVIKLGAGFGLALYFAQAAMETTAAWAIFGVTAGEIVATAILILLYLPDRQKLRRHKARSSARQVLRAIGAIAVPMVVSSGVAGAMNIADVTMIRAQLLQIRFTPETAERFLLQFSSHTAVFDDLLETLRISVDGARWLYGAYSGYALTVFHLPAGIMATLGVSILPVIAGALALNQRQRVEHTAQLALKIILLTALPCAAVLGLFAEPVLGLLFHNTASAPMLRLLSPCLVFVCLSQILTAVLNASGMIMRPFVHGLVGMVIKLLGNLLLITRPELHILGAVVSANISYLVVVALDAWAVRRRLGLHCQLLKALVKPLFSTAVMAGVMLMLYRPLCVLFAGEIPALLATLFVGGAAYCMMLLMTAAVSRADLQTLRG